VSDELLEGTLVVEQFWTGVAKAIEKAIRPAGLKAKRGRR
jgi:hypothetical protein|tara:strand:- start:494 stop:613 length:120 start_codon:yes stop_codon:yes gene_type:complete